MNPYILASATPPTGCTGSTISTLNLSAYYKFNGNALDTTANNLDLTSFGSPTYSTGYFDDAADLNGTSQYFTHADNTLFEGSGNSLSVFAWCQIDGWDVSSQSYIAAKRTSGVGFRFWLENGFFGSTFGGTNSFQAVTIPTGGTWAHIGFTYDNNTVRFYLDGVQVGPGNTIGSKTMASASELFIGRNNLASSGYFYGLLDEWSIWQRVLTSGETLSLYNSTCPLSGA